MAFEKIYIGKGKLTPVKSVQCSVKLSELQRIAHDYNGEMWCMFEVAEMKQPDNYGKTHTVYQNKRSDDGQPVPAQSAPAQSAPVNPGQGEQIPGVDQDQDLPF